MFAFLSNSAKKGNFDIQVTLQTVYRDVNKNSNVDKEMNMNKYEYNYKYEYEYKKSKLRCYNRAE